jgi:transcription termination factor Rho
MLLNELQTMASSLGISGTGKMRKGDLIAAIEQSQADGRVPRARAEAPARGQVAALGDTPRGEVRGDVRMDVRDDVHDEGRGSVRTAVRERESVNGAAEGRAPRRASRAGGPPEARETRAATEERTERTERADRTERAERNGAVDRTTGERTAGDRADRTGGDRAERADRGEHRAERNGADRNVADRNGDHRGERNGRDQRPVNHDRGDRGQTDRAASNGRPQGERDFSDDDDEGGRRGRRSRFRDRRRGRGEREGGVGGGGGGGGEREPQVSEDDVLVQVAGIVDVLDNYAFVRTSGYLAGPNDVYVSMAQIKRYGLRRGDAVTGAVRAARDGEQRRDKYNPLVRLDTINGMDPEEARRRPEFYKLTPLYPQERLRLETEPHVLTTRVIDLVMPIGKGQRALIVSPPKAGKTMIQQAIANAITQNNPECHLMVVLVDERPEEVTDMQRSVKGEVIASTFDRPPQDHTTVAELAIERAKRLVELGHDVVVLLDSITRLGRAYNLAAPGHGRTLSGGLDSTALYPAKRFLGAARNIENGGSLTIIANALVETGSMMDTVIFEEFKGTGNAELKLDRKISEKRVFPAVDIDGSGTRNEEVLLAPDEYAIITKLRRALQPLDSTNAVEQLLDNLRKTKSNAEFLLNLAKSASKR